MGRDDISSEDVQGRSQLHYVIVYLGLLEVNCLCRHILLNQSYIDYEVVQLQPTLDILTGYVSSRPMTRTSGC
jgi:hypothetical protein